MSLCVCFEFGQETSETANAMLKTAKKRFLHKTLLNSGEADKLLRLSLSLSFVTSQSDFGLLQFDYSKP
jgi:hypothetical protein